MKTLVLAEKPSVGRELGRVLRCSKKTKTFMEVDGYIVTWAMGHLIELADPAAYEGRWATWSLDYLPMLPEKMKHKVIRGTSGQFKAIKGLFPRKDVEHLVIATDAGREGELVARWITRLGGWKGPISRLWISSQTDAAIRDGFTRLKPGKRVVSTRDVSDHHALIPTEQKVNVSRFNPEERALGEMIIRRFIEALMPDYRYRLKTVVVEAAVTKKNRHVRETDS